MAAATDTRHPDADPLGAGIGPVVAAASLPLAGVGVALLAAQALGLRLPGCPVRAVAGRPCPFCGLTRLAEWVVDGRLVDAVGVSPAGVGLLAVLGVLAVARAATLVTGGRWDRWLRWVRSPVPAVVLAGLVVAHWATTLTTDALTVLAAATSR